MSGHGWSGGMGPLRSGHHRDLLYPLLRTWLVRPCWLAGVENHLPSRAVCDGDQVVMKSGSEQLET